MPKSIAIISKIYISKLIHSLQITNNVPFNIKILSNIYRQKYNN